MPCLRLPLPLLPIACLGALVPAIAHGETAPAPVVRRVGPTDRRSGVFDRRGSPGRDRRQQPQGRRTDDGRSCAAGDLARSAREIIGSPALPENPYSPEQVAWRQIEGHRLYGQPSDAALERVPVRAVSIDRSRHFDRDLRGIAQSNPEVHRKFERWLADVETQGLAETRKIPGYHDEPLSGVMRNCRSVRMSGGYRLYYRVGSRSDELTLLGLDHHDYRLTADACR